VPTNRSIHSQDGGTMFGRSAFVYKPEADTYSVRRVMFSPASRRCCVAIV